MVAPGLIQHTSETDEWYSPPELVEPCRRAMGWVDLDPASCPKANEVVKAGHIFTCKEDGLVQRWWGNVYLNPPYGTRDDKPSWSHAEISFGRYSNKEIWVEKFLLEFQSGRVKQAILVLTASVGDAWFHRLIVPTAGCICFPRRISFLRADHTHGRHSGQPGASVVIYYGDHKWRFAVEMSELGWVVMDWIRPCLATPKVEPRFALCRSRG